MRQPEDIEAGSFSSTTSLTRHEDDEDSYDFSMNEGIEMEDLLGKSTSRERARAVRPTRSHQSPRLHSSRPRGFLQRLWDGPDEPRDDPPRVKPGSRLYRFEKFPQYIRSRYSQPAKVLIYVAYCAVWMAIFGSIVGSQFRNRPAFRHQDDHDPGLEIVQLACSDQYRWWGKNGKCGLDAELCGPFEDHEVVIKCPALCDREGWTFSSIPVGDELVKYKGFVVGGGATERTGASRDALSLPYRADSYPCAAGVHAGILSPFFGGCIKLKAVGSQLQFEATSGHYGTSDSVGFPGFFPASYIFTRLPEIAYCYDYRLIVLVINILFGLPVVYLASGLITFWTITIVGYLTILLSLDPPLMVDASDPETIADLFATGFQRVLPLCFVLYTFWRCTTKRTFADPSCTLAKVALWYPLFWVGVCNNLTFDRLPLDRLTPSSFKQQPGSITVALTLFVIILVCAGIQAFKLWQSGRFKKYLLIYLTLIFTILTLVAIPGLSLRIHHYILAMLLIPGTATRGFSAYLFQGILYGLLLSGIARWNFASVMETDFTLLRDDPGKSLIPPVFSNLTGHGIIDWYDSEINQADLDESGLTDYSLLVNDIERYVGNSSTIDFKELLKQDDSLNQLVNEELRQHADKQGDITLFLRLGRSPPDWRIDHRSDYTRAGKLKWPSGKWQEPEKGLT